MQTVKNRDAKECAGHGKIKASERLVKHCYATAQKWSVVKW